MVIFIPNAAPWKIQIEFDGADINASSTAYPNATVTGRYFHLCQRIVHKVSYIGLKIVNESDDIALQNIRCLPASAFAPSNDVVEDFKILVAVC